MGAGKTILLVFLSIVLVVSLIVLGILWGSRTLLYPQVYEHAFNESGAYNDVNLSQVPGGTFIELPSGGIPVLVDNYLSNTLSYLRGDTNELNLTLEVDPSKLKDFIVKSAESLPVCPSGVDPFGQGSVPSCRPEGVNLSEYAGTIMQNANISLAGNNQINLVKVFGINVSGFNEARAYVQSYSFYTYLAIALVVILTIMMFFVSDTRTRWSGIDFVIAGVAVFFAGSFLTGLPSAGITGQLGFLDIVIKDILASLYSEMKIYAYSVGAIGVALFALSFFIKKKKDAKSKAPVAAKTVPENSGAGAKNKNP